VSLDFVNDWNSHLQTLLPKGAFDATFPWSRPDCDHLDKLKEGDAYRCTEFNFSDSFYDIVDAYFAKKNSGLDTAQNWDDFMGKRICRPDSYSLSGMTAVGLEEPKITLVRPATVSECFQALADGTVDIVHIESQVAQETLDKMSLRGDVSENPNLAHVKSLRVLIDKNNPHGEEIMSEINKGLAAMRESGEWYDIVSAGLKAAAAKSN
ncbi:MAG: transporter substrate-binding domain-containing protein, partial [Alphaproteobacteria bacterium]|nr:transporter substrate-binding domain-containing protein [Alphaproteobacteria bacterium]